MNKTTGEQWRVVQTCIEKALELHDTKFTKTRIDPSPFVEKTIMFMGRVYADWADWPFEELTGTNPVYKQIYKSV